MANSHYPYHKHTKHYTQMFLYQNTMNNLNTSFQAFDSQAQISKNQNFYTSATRISKNQNFYTSTTHLIDVPEQESASQAKCTESTKGQWDTQVLSNFSDCFIAPEHISGTQSKTFAKQQVNFNESFEHAHPNTLNETCSGETNYQTVAHSHHVVNSYNNNYFERNANSHSSTFKNVKNPSPLNGATKTAENATAYLSLNVKQMKYSLSRHSNEYQHFEGRKNTMFNQYSSLRITHDKPVTYTNNVPVGEHNCDVVDKSLYSETTFEKNANLHSHSSNAFINVTNSSSLNAPTATVENTAAYLTPNVKRMNHNLVRHLNQSQTFEDRKNAIVSQYSFPKATNDKLMTCTNNIPAKDQNSALIDKSRFYETYNEMSNTKFDLPISALHEDKTNREKCFVSMHSINERDSTFDTHRLTSTKHKSSQKNLQYEEIGMFYSFKSSRNLNRFKFNNTNAVSSITKSYEVSFREKEKKLGVSNIDENYCYKNFNHFNEKDSYGSNYFDIENLIRIAKAIGCSFLNCSCDYDGNYIPPLPTTQTDIFQNSAPRERKWPNMIFKKADTLGSFPQLEISNNIDCKPERETWLFPSVKYPAVSGNIRINTENINNKPSFYYQDRSVSKEKGRPSLSQTSEREKNTVVAEKNNFEKVLDEINEYLCPHCGKRLVYVSCPDDQSSLQNIYVRKFVCEFCQKESCSQECFQKHELTHAHCTNNVNKKFPILKQHLTKQGLTDKKQESYVGNVYEKSSDDKENIPTNVINDNGEKFHSCDECHKRFVRKHNLTKHKLSHSEKKKQSSLLPDKKLVCCEVCYKEFCAKKNLNRHMRRFHSTKYNI